MNTVPFVVKHGESVPSVVTGVYIVAPQLFYQTRAKLDSHMGPFLR